MNISIKDIDIRILNMHTRMPFKYGIASLERVPHLFLQATLEVDGQIARGTAADGLAPKWFTKNPETTFKHDIAEMMEVIQNAGKIAREAPPGPSVFALWRDIYERQKDWGEAKGYPPLLWGFGVTLVERALIEAFCRIRKTTFARAIRENSLGMSLESLRPELAGKQPSDYLPDQPLRSILARHTVGLADPLTTADIPQDEKLDDGLPQSLDTCIETYGLWSFKIKLCGDVEKDLHRMHALASIIQARTPDFTFTLDGNEQYKEVEPFIEVWNGLNADPGIAPFMKHLYFVEQPLHRDVALTPETAEKLLGWKNRPPMIIDESDGALDSALIALASGYVGTSHKNCKGIFKGLANRCLIEHRNRNNPAKPYIMSGEDLSNVGPVALIQDLASMSALNIFDVERNGQHYWLGLSMFPEAIQIQTLEIHPDLYTRHGTPNGQHFPKLKITHGEIATGSVVDSPYGAGFELDLSSFTPIQDWTYASLEP